MSCGMTYSHCLHCDSSERRNLRCDEFYCCCEKFSTVCWVGCVISQWCISSPNSNYTPPTHQHNPHAYLTPDCFQLRYSVCVCSAWITVSTALISHTGTLFYAAVWQCTFHSLHPELHLFQHVSQPHKQTKITTPNIFSFTTFTTTTFQMRGNDWIKKMKIIIHCNCGVLHIQMIFFLPYGQIMSFKCTLHVGGVVAQRLEKMALWSKGHQFNSPEWQHKKKYGKSVCLCWHCKSHLKPTGLKVLFPQQQTLCMLSLCRFFSDRLNPHIFWLK